MKYKEIEALSEAELLEKEKKLKEQLYNFNYQRYSGRVEKPHMFTLLRKDVARIKTALSQLKGRGVSKTENKDTKG